MPKIESIPHVCDVSEIAGPGADPNIPPNVLVEVPHGATEMKHLAFGKSLTEDYPGDDYDDFFKVNTDQGAPEYARRFAELVTSPDVWKDPAMQKRAAANKVRLIRCLLPRTIVDVNRVWDLSGESFRGARLTLGTAPFISDKDEIERIFSYYDAYQKLVDQAYETVCGNGGYALNLHSYAPISVQLTDEDDIVDAVHDAYRPENYKTFPKRPTVCLITDTAEGECLADRDLVNSVMQAYRGIDIDIARNNPYRLERATVCYRRAKRYPRRTIVVEISRAALAKPFEPFKIMNIDAEKVNRMTMPLAESFMAVTS